MNPYKPVRAALYDEGFNVMATTEVFNMDGEPRFLSLPRPIKAHWLAYRQDRLSEGGDTLQDVLVKPIPPARRYLSRGETYTFKVIP